MDYQALWSELTRNSAALGYADPNNPANDLTNVGLLNDETQSVSIESITGGELWENTVLSDYAALSTAERQAYDVLISLSTINVSEGSNSRTALANLFPAGSTTRSSLVALVQETKTVSRATQLGWPRIYTSDIETARERYGG